MGQEATALDTPRSQEGCANEDGEGVTDLFKPLPPLPACAVGKEVRPLTIRSVVLGLIFGSLVSAFNVYLGLKTGFVFPANMFGAIFGFGVARFLSQTLAHIPVLGNGGVFGPTENNMIQAARLGRGRAERVLRRCCAGHVPPVTFVGSRGGEPRASGLWEVDFVDPGLRDVWAVLGGAV